MANVGGEVRAQNYKETAGSWTLTTEFPVPQAFGRGLALDPATDTLWMVDNDLMGLVEYSKTGVLLSSMPNIISGEERFVGAEFAIPEPASVGLLALGAALALRRRG